MEDQTENIRVIEIRVYALGLTKIDDCMKDAMLLAIKEGVDVRLICDKKEYLICSDSLLDTIVKTK